MAIAVSIAQRDRINADFVGYVTISHRIAHDFWHSVSGHWSPLYSWLMLPLIALGVPDLVAGRIVLLAAGVVYICAIYEISKQFGRVVLMGMLTCAVIQAAVWATYLLDPDLLASGLLFGYAVTLFHPTRRKAIVGGIFGGLAYLAKAYMFPFVLVHLPISLWLRKRAVGVSEKRNDWVVIWLLYLAGMLFVSIPWIWVLSIHEHRLTFSIVGTSSHADLAPGIDKQDLLFNPGLVADYIVEPRLAPDWSPFASRRNLIHQLEIVGRNWNVTLGALPLWVLFVIGAGVWRLVAKNLLRRAEPVERFAVWWGFTAVAIYVAGYSVVLVEPRYTVPVCAPILCLVGLIWLKDLDGVPTAAVIGLVALTSVQQIQRLVQNAIVHYQTRDVRDFEPIARKLRELTPTDALIAANRFHNGLVIAYADDRVRTYLGMPRAPDLAGEVKASRASVYVRLLDPREPMGIFDTFVPAGWKKVAEADSNQCHAEIYVAP
jgi:hypothetical protein